MWFLTWFAETTLEFLKTHPEVLLAIAAFLLLPLFLNQDPNLPFNWPVVGRLPHLLSQLHRLHDLLTYVLIVSGGTHHSKNPLEDVLLTCDPANVNHIFNVNFANYPKGDDFSEIFDILGGGIFNADDESWREQRKMAHALITDVRFKSFMAKASKKKVQHGLIPLLDHIEQHHLTVDLQDVFMRFTFDSTCLMIFGIDPGCLSIGFQTVPFAKAIDSVEEVLAFRHVLPKRWWKLLRWLRIGKEKKTAEAERTIDESIAQYIALKKQEHDRCGGTMKEEGVDLLTSYLGQKDEIMNNKSGGDEEFDKFLRDTTLNLMIAGRDTTSAALSWFFWLVTNNPTVEAKILKELSGTGGVFDVEKVDKLVYLHACLCESLRLFPPVPFEHKGVLQPDVLPSGAKVDQRTRIVFSLYAMGRMKWVWGEDCKEFKPERWITERGTIRHEPSYKFLSFNSGQRTCLGKNMAFVQMKAVAAAVLWKFEVRVVEGHQVVPKLSIILHMKNGMMVRIRKRERKSCDALKFQQKEGCVN